MQLGQKIAEKMRDAEVLSSFSYQKAKAGNRTAK